MIEKILAQEKKDKKVEKDKNVLVEPVKKVKDEKIEEDEEASLKEYESYDSDKKIAAYDELNEDLSKLTEKEFADLKYKKFGQRAVNNVEQIKTRLHEVRQNFYNRLESKKLIKKFGKIPFTEHLSVTNSKACEIAEGARLLEINDDIKREMAFYNLTRENVMKGMGILVQAQVPISRPDDFLAEMLKTDVHMAKVKSQLLKQ